VQAFLGFNDTFQGIDGAAEFSKKVASRGVHNVAMMLDD
jgi:hypothetical protein